MPQKVSPLAGQGPSYTFTPQALTLRSQSSIEQSRIDEMNLLETLFIPVILLLIFLYFRKYQLAKQLIRKTNELTYLYQENKRIAAEKEELQRNVNSTMVNRFKVRDAKLRVKMIRNQLSPHFIFNSLNQIQEKVLTSDESTSLKYITQLSKFIRKILELEDSLDIRLQEELDLLKLYLQIESSRLGQIFSYNISVDDSIDCDKTLVPSLFIHPFVENMIWNGKYGVAGDKLLSVKIKATSSILICFISCAIVSRVSSGEVSKVLLESELPKTLTLAAERIKLLGQIHNKESNSETTCVFNDIGLLKEMRTFIRIPIIEASRL